MPWWVWSLLLVPCLLSAGTAFYVATSRPIVTKRLLQDLMSEIAQQASKLEAVTVRWQEYRESLESLVEQLEVTEERTERNRRRAAAAESRRRAKEGQGGNGAEPDMSNPAVLRQIARQRGFDI